MGPVAKRILKWVGYVLFGMLSFVVALYVTFPFERIKELAEQKASSDDLEVTIDELGPAVLLGVKATGVHVTMTVKPKPATQASVGAMGIGGVPSSATPPASDGQAPASQPAPEKPKKIRFVIDKVIVKPGILAAIGGSVDLDVAITAYGGEADVHFEQSKTAGITVDATARQVNLGQVAGLGDLVGLPFAGMVSGKVALTVPRNNWQKAEGEIELDCEGVTVGDGKAMIKVPGNPLLSMGLTLPRIRLGTLGGRVKIEAGVATMENVSGKSPDMDVVVEGRIHLRNPVEYSNAEAYLKFKVSPELMKREAKFQIIETALGTAKRDDGFYGIQLVGPLKTLRPLPSKLGPPEQPGMRGPGGRPGPAGLGGR